MKISKGTVDDSDNCYCNDNKSYLTVKDLSLILTKREIEVLRYVVLGLSNEEIGKELYISNNTIKIHIKNIMHKLREVSDINIKIKNRIQLAVVAIKYGIVSI